jgi:hypothetical protein
MVHVVGEMSWTCKTLSMSFLHVPVVITALLYARVSWEMRRCVQLKCLFVDYIDIAIACICDENGLDESSDFEHNFLQRYLHVRIWYIMSCGIKGMEERCSPR